MRTNPARQVHARIPWHDCMAHNPSPQLPTSTRCCAAPSPWSTQRRRPKISDQRLRMWRTASTPRTRRQVRGACAHFGRAESTGVQGRAGGRAGGRTQTPWPPPGRRPAGDQLACLEKDVAAYAQVRQRVIQPRPVSSSTAGASPSGRSPSRALVVVGRLSSTASAWLRLQLMECLRLQQSQEALQPLLTQRPWNKLAQSYHFSNDV